LVSIYSGGWIVQIRGKPYGGLVNMFPQTPILGQVLVITASIAMIRLALASRLTDARTGGR
jgi:hypothetical protein